MQLATLTFVMYLFLSLEVTSSSFMDESDVPLFTHERSHDVTFSLFSKMYQKLNAVATKVNWDPFFINEEATYT